MTYPPIYYLDVCPCTDLFQLLFSAAMTPSVIHPRTDPPSLCVWWRAQVCVGVKKRLLVLGWATGGFVAKRDVALNDQPRAMLMPTPDSCILAYKYVYGSLSFFQPAPSTPC